jgi:hypothetical protein
MKYLKAAITVRILDSLGVVSKEMQDVRNKMFLLNSDPDIFAGKVVMSDDSSMIFLYSEQSDTKFMITTLVNKNVNNWFCFISADIEDEEPDLNRMFSTYFKDKTLRFREVSFFEAASILRTYEVIRDNMPYWIPLESSKKTANEEYLGIMMEFIKTFEVEDEHVHNEETTKSHNC